MSEQTHWPVSRRPLGLSDKRGITDFSISDISPRLLSAAISTGRRNTLTKTHEDGVYADESKESLRFHGGRESRVVGPLKASRGAGVDWASV